MYKVSQCELNTHYGVFDFFCFNYGNCENDNVLVIKSKKDVEIPTIRIQSACFTSEIFRSKDCDCHEQLESSLEIINKDGGLLVYLLQDGRGAGIFLKVQGMHLSQKKNLNTAEAYDKLQISRDPRQYDRVIGILNYFKITNINLLTNNPRKINGITKSGIVVNRVPLEIEPTQHSVEYLKSKKKELGHLFEKYI
ncbi:GTP cyclohydrolase II RibA [Parapedobacter indicus]|uniref:3,4-dihydroxy 2-butanone 4-phosphate synthase / GTP cyclohydrolase II n=1 Tax=Parapedobacter indicus TaxID=1477437 RepID=A0A1I3CJK9_9SPHI|nr:GTP cyclohydrolase II RibA [Parapedobacter indicus]PPL04274.1 3,4-dihydroxy 2-butanone 4-phosphate synthase/GTP cyclohydrolase II [Parapedobacter indicus]SFH74645.1 3,4-dihydroxy 2-butanone 4-phosphate synthase / GTP cyclohydrolase II [Parapedobacter indicus]